MPEGDIPPQSRPRQRNTSKPIRVVPPPKPGPPTAAIAAGVALLLAVVVAGAWIALKPGPQPPPPPPVPTESTQAPPSPSGPPPELTHARELSLELRKVLDDASDRMQKNAHAVKPPYPWRVLPERYREIVRTVRGKPFEREFWLEHTRKLAVAIARLSAAVSADPDNPDAPMVMTVANENARNKDYESVIRQVAEVMKGPESIHKLMEVCFLIVSGDTNQANALIAKLPPLPEGEASREEEICRRLARTLLAWTHKGSKPLEFARKGLELVHDRTAPTLEEWEWALILVYASVPSLFHEDFGKKEAGQDVVDHGLTLLGRTGTPPPFFRDLDPAMLGEVRRVIRDAGKRGMGFLGPDAGAGPPASDLVLGTTTARWMIVAADPGKEEGQLWYSIYLGWLTPATPALAASQDAGVKKALAELEATATARAKTEQTGVMSAMRARLALVRGDGTGGLNLLDAARARAEKFGYKTQDETVWQALDRLGIELKSKK